MSSGKSKDTAKNNKILPDYLYPTAGHIWIVPEYHLMLRGGHWVVAVSELRRINSAVAWALCAPGAPDARMTEAEVAFLNDVADESFRRQGALADGESGDWETKLEKRGFLEKIFGHVLADDYGRRLSGVPTSNDVLTLLRARILIKGAVFDIQKQVSEEQR